MFICNICKKVFPDLDGYGLRIQYRFGYGSPRDGDLLDATICNPCADKAAAALDSICAISPIVQVDEQALYGTDESDFDFGDDEDGSNLPPIFS